MNKQPKQAWSKEDQANILGYMVVMSIIGFSVLIITGVCIWISN